MRTLVFVLTGAGAGIAFMLLAAIYGPPVVAYIREAGPVVFAIFWSAVCGGFGGFIVDRVTDDDGAW